MFWLTNSKWSYLEIEESSRYWGRTFTKDTISESWESREPDVLRRRLTSVRQKKGGSCAAGLKTWRAYRVTQISMLFTPTGKPKINVVLKFVRSVIICTHFPFGWKFLDPRVVYPRTVRPPYNKNYMSWPSLPLPHRCTMLIPQPLDVDDVMLTPNQDQPQINQR